MRKINFSVYFIVISVFTLITLFVIIVQSSYSNLIKPLNQVNNIKLTPIDPNLDLSVISEIEKRDDYGSSGINIVFTNTSTASAVPTPETSTASPTINQQVTQND